MTKRLLIEEHHQILAWISQARQEVADIQLDGVNFENQGKGQLADMSKKIAEWKLEITRLGQKMQVKGFKTPDGVWIPGGMVDSLTPPSLALLKWTSVVASKEHKLFSSAFNSELKSRANVFKISVARVANLETELMKLQNAHQDVEWKARNEA